MHRLAYYRPDGVLQIDYPMDFFVRDYDPAGEGFGLPLGVRTRANAEEALRVVAGRGYTLGGPAPDTIEKVECLRRDVFTAAGVLAGRLYEVRDTPANRAFHEGNAPAGSTGLAWLPPGDPAPRRFRDCLALAGGVLAVDVPRARARRLAEIRAERGRRLQRSDALWIRAFEENRAADRFALEAARRRLRDLPAEAAAALDARADAADVIAYEPDWPALPAGD